MEAKEFEALAEAGLNPYQVYRQRDIQAELAAAQSALAAGQTVRQQQVLDRLAAEDREYARKMARAAADAQVRLRVLLDAEGGKSRQCGHGPSQGIRTGLFRCIGRGYRTGA
jgi:hypothetical protein